MNKREIEHLIEWVVNTDWQYIHDNQERIITSVSLLLNPNFRTEINQIRTSYKIPKRFYTNPSNDKTWNKILNWVESQTSTPPYYQDDPIFISLSQKYNFELRIYWDFLIGLIYENDILPQSHFSLNHRKSSEEHRFKARLEIIDRHNRELIINEKEPIGYIRIYKDTSINQLHNFIDENKEAINSIKRELENYPQVSNNGSFKRDLLIFLYSIQNYSSTEIADKITEDLEKDKLKLKLSEDEIVLEENNVRQIIRNIKKQILQRTSSNR